MFPAHAQLVCHTRSCTRPYARFTVRAHARFYARASFRTENHDLARPGALACTLACNLAQEATINCSNGCIGISDVE